MTSYTRTLQIFFLGILISGSFFLSGCGGFILGGCTEKLTQYRDSFYPVKGNARDATPCVLRDSTGVGSREYEEYEVPNFAHWGRNCKRIVYRIPKQGDGPAFAEKQNRSVIPDENCSAYVHFYQGRQYVGMIRQKVVAEEISYRNSKGDQFWEDKKRGYPKGYLSDLKSVLFIFATRSGEGTQIVRLTKANSGWVESGSYIIEKPIHEDSGWIDTWNAVTYIGYGVTIPIDTVNTVIWFPFLPIIMGLAMSPY